MVTNTIGINAYKIFKDEKIDLSYIDIYVSKIILFLMHEICHRKKILFGDKTINTPKKIGMQRTERISLFREVGTIQGESGYYLEFLICSSVII